jgi:aldose 1-epimerase
MDRSLTLSSGTLELELRPSSGGAIGRLGYSGYAGRTAVLRPSPDPLQNILQAACFPLVPFANRIRGGCFRFRDQEVRLDPNLAGDPSPIHGQGWTSSWRVESSSDSDAVLAFDHSAGEWPWAYEARQHFRLGEDCLRLRLTCRNVSSEQMPCGLGLHPYFNCGPETRIQTGVEEVWAVDANVLPAARLPATGRYDISDGKICGRDLDNGYGGWSGRAIISDPAWPFEIELSSPSARFFQVYSPPEGGFFAAEPVSHANAALNQPEGDWPSLGIELLEPGDEAALEMRIDMRVK